MPKKSNKVANQTKQNVYFDNENLKLILICFLFGIFGVHKFMQGKKGQGICFILLDLTIIGLLISFVWAFFNLFSLTFKSGNKAGNMIIGTCCLCGGLFGWPLYFDDAKTVIIKETVTAQDPVVFEENLLCEVRRSDIPNYAHTVYLKADSTKADIIVGDSDKVITLTKKIYGEKLKVYEGYVDWNVPSVNIKYSSNPEHKITLRMQGRDIRLEGKLDDDTDFYSYYCTVKK